MPSFDESDTRVTKPAPRPAACRPLDLAGVRSADLYDAWVFAEVDATLALAAWRSAERADKPDAHAAYLAALDREAHASDLLENRVRGALSRRPRPA